MARNFVVSEVLSCVINNLTSIENCRFQEKIIEFFNSEELSAAKKQIFSDYENVKGEKFKSHSGKTSKNDKLKSIVEIVKFIFNNSIDTAV